MSITQTLILTTTTSLPPGESSIIWNFGAPSTVPVSSPVASTTTTSTSTLSSSSLSNSPVSSSPSSQDTNTIIQSSGSGTSQGTQPSNVHGCNGTTNTHPQGHSDGVSSGAAAGIGLGCAVAGAVLAILLFLLFRKKRSQPRSTQRQADGISLGKYSDDGTTKAVGRPNVSVHEKPVDASLLALLPLPIPEREVGDSMSKLGSAVKNHVKSYYAAAQGTGMSSRTKSLSNSLERLLGERSPVPANQLENLLSKTNSRLGALRFLIAWAILCNIQPDARIETTLLPPDLAQILADIASIETRNGGTDHLKLLGRWRQISGALLQAQYGDGTVKAQDRRHRNISELAGMLNNALEPYATERNDTERARNLEELIKRGARFGYLLFSQPTSWGFQWDQPGRRQGDWVVFPSLVQNRDDQGRPRDPAIRYAEPQVVQLPR